MISPKLLITRWLAVIRMTANQREIMATIAKPAAIAEVIYKCDRKKDRV